MLCDYVSLVVLTHPHDDHITGLVEVLNDYKMGQVLSPDLDCDLAICDEWFDLIEGMDINYTIACAGQQIEFDGVVIEVLNPQEALLKETESDVDNNSVVLHVSMDDISFLLTADLMWQGEFELLKQRLVLESTVLKVGHHGSVTSTTTDFLAAVNPQLAVISADPEEYGHPSNEVVARLEAELGAENIYITDEDGTIEFITDGKRLWVKTQG